MKYLIITILGAIFIVFGDVYAQGQFHFEPFVYQSSDILLSESDSPQTNWMPVLYTSVLVLEVVFLTGSIFTRYKAGAYTVGALEGIYALSAGIIALTGGSNFGVLAPAILIGGLGTLSWYNFKFADIHSNNRKFLTNFIGLNTTVGLALLASVTEDHLFAASNGAFQITGSATGLGLIWNF
jgi:hypothetical protein